MGAMPRSSRAFLVEDNPVMRRGLVEELAKSANVDVVASASSEEDALRWLAAHAAEVDVVVLDLVLAQGSGLGVLKRMKRQGIAVDAVVLTNHDSADMRHRCESAGAAALFDKAQQQEDFLEYLRTRSARPAA
jgi:DNA-binding NarL/FixJ family response regulator